MYDPVEAQLIAYNNRDVDAFLACYAIDCIVEDGAGTRLMTGHTEMRPAYTRMFAASPNLRCKIVQRICIGDYVIDEEEISGRVPETKHAVAVYRVVNNLIEHVRFYREAH